MTFRVRPLANKKGRRWKVQLLTYKGNSVSCVDIKSADLGRLGFIEEASIESAKARAKVLNDEKTLKSREQKRQRIRARIHKETVQAKSTFPLENEFLHWLDARGIGKASKFNSHWHNAKRIILDLELKIEELAANQKRIYRYFESKAYSLQYLKKVLLVLNQYSEFYCQTHRIYFERLKLPRGVIRQRIMDANFEKNPSGKKALELSPALLEKAKSKLEERHYNWIYLSLWLGLRPMEVDRLKQKALWRVETFKQTKIVWIFQKKLVEIDRERRHKPIPLVEKEQLEALRILQEGNFERPLVKTFRAHLGDGYGTYSGRKGFEALMRDRGHPLENVSQWLGHQSIEQTWRNYVSKNIPRF